MRRPILAGNWKMNKTRDEAIHFVLGVDYKLPKNGVDCIICAPAIILRDIVKRADILQVGAQNMNENDKGAYTGEISPIMLKDTGVKYVIIGHSERRQYYNETDSIVNAKIKKALEYDLNMVSLAYLDFIFLYSVLNLIISEYLYIESFLTSL